MIKNINELVGEALHDLNTGEVFGIIEWISHKIDNVYNIMYRDILAQPNFLEIEILDKDPRSLN